MPDNREVTNEADATARAIRLTQLDRVSSKISARRVRITQDLIPFLGKQFIGRAAWRVDFEDASLKLDSAIPGFEDQYRRKFSVFLGESNGELLYINSKFRGAAPDMRPEPTGEPAEVQLLSEGEIYHGLPEVQPKISFLDALDIVLSKGMGSPFLAKEIDGAYVLHSRMASRPKPVWMIMLRGLPPMPARGSAGDKVPVWQRNHMRNVIDAMTGEFMFATNSPQPE
jgi:hypothetical protein